jgi:Peptidase family M50
MRFAEASGALCLGLMGAKLYEDKGIMQQNAAEANNKVDGASMSSHSLPKEPLNPGVARERPQADRVSVITAVILLCLPILFVCLNLWSASFLNFSCRALRPINAYTSSVTEYSFASFTRLIWVNTLALGFTVVIHEIGHLVAGLASGHRFEAIAVGPFRACRSGRISIAFDTRNVVFGFIQMRPKAGPSVVPSLIMVLAGPTANLAAAVGIFLFSGHPIALCLVGWSALTGVTSLIPFQHLGLQSDGRAIYALLFERERNQGLERKI